MSVAGPAVTVSSLLAKIQASYEKKDFTKAEELIKQADDPSDAQAIYDVVFKTVRTNCWGAFLKNRHLKQVIWHRPLIDIINRLITRIKLNDEKVTQNANRILLQIVQNKDWCRMLSYRYFIDFATVSRPLAVYMVSKPTFLKHLHNTHFSLLLKKLPDLAVHLIETLDGMILDDEDYTDWVVGILKWLLVNDATARNIMLSSDNFNDLLEQLFIEFDEDRFFVIEVLKQTELCRRWLKSAEAYQHPLLGIKDYQDLAAHYKSNDIILSMQYIALAGRLLEEELGAVINKMSSLSITYTPAHEDSQRGSTTATTKEPTIASPHPIDPKKQFF